jgi:large subunit ribosomal protein L32e
MVKKDVIDSLTKVKGIGQAKAEEIYKNGFDSLEKLKKSSVEDLVKIDGVTESLAKELVKSFKAKTEPKKADKQKPQAEVKKEPKKKPETKKEVVPEKKPERKKEAKTKKPAKEEKEAIEEEGEEEEEGYKVKKKPKLDAETKKRLSLRKDIKKRTPTFLREEWFRYKRIPHNWRRPDGITSKMRINLKYRPSKVRVGFRGPKDVRGLHSSGFEEIIVFNANDLDKIDPDTQAARIGSSVGTKKRMDIEKKAEKLNIRILNL